MKYTVQNTAGAGKPKDVWLDGRLIEKAIEADPEEGYVVALKEDEDGNIEITADNELIPLRLTGVVVVTDRAV